MWWCAVCQPEFLAIVWKKPGAEAFISQVPAFFCAKNWCKVTRYKKKRWTAVVPWKRWALPKTKKLWWLFVFFHIKMHSSKFSHDFFSKLVFQFLCRPLHVRDSQYAAVCSGKLNPTRKRMTNPSPRGVWKQQILAHFLTDLKSDLSVMKKYGYDLWSSFKLYTLVLRTIN